MRWHLYKMSLQGTIAVANLALYGTALIVRYGVLPDVVRVDKCTDFELLLLDASHIMLFFLAFPLGWLYVLCPLFEIFLFEFSPIARVVFMAVFVPLNAYLWGYVVSAAVRWLRARFTPS